MRKILKLVLTILGALSLAITLIVPMEVRALELADGADLSPLAELTEQPPDAGVFGGVGVLRALQAPDNPAIVRSRFVEVRFGVVGPRNWLEIKRGRAPAERLRLNLFADADFTAILEYADAHLSGSYSWVGHLEGIEHSRVVLTILDGLMVGNVRTPRQLFQVRQVDGDIHVVYELDQSALPSEAEPLTAGRELQESVQEIERATADDGSVIDVLVLYTAQARNGAGSAAQMVELINTAETETNDSYDLSGVVQRIRLVPPTEISYTEVGGDSSTDLDRLKGTSDGHMDVAHDLRNAYAADTVVLVVENSDWCGLAWGIMSPETTAFADRAFCLVARDGCLTGYFSFGHELGHLMGARHDWYVDDTVNSPFSYNHGYVREALDWRTIMAYDDECDDAGHDCTRLQYWSNPDITYGGEPMGVPEGTSTSCSTGDAAPDCDADNRKTLNETRDTVANFVPGNLSPIVYVDWSNTGTEDGSAAHPFNTVTEGAYRAAPGATLSIESGYYSETLVISHTGYLLIDRPMTLVATNGLVTIGKEE